MRRTTSKSVRPPNSPRAILDAALELSSSERGLVAEAILDSLETDDFDSKDAGANDVAWKAEIGRRVELLKRENWPGSPSDEVVARIEARLAEKRSAKAPKKRSQ